MITIAPTPLIPARVVAEASVSVAEAVTQPTPDSDRIAASTSWQLHYRRALMIHLKVDPDTVDLTSVVDVYSWDTPWGYSEYNRGDAQFSLHVSWRSRTPRYEGDEPEWDGLYAQYQDLSNEEVAEFLNTLTGL